MGSSVVWVPHPDDLRRALVDGSREVICRGIIWWLRLEGARCYLQGGGGGGGDMEMNYDVEISPRK